MPLIKIKTKFKVRDVVWYLDSNKITSNKISVVKTSSSDYLDKTQVIHVQNVSYYYRGNSGDDKVLPVEDVLFKTKQELIDSL